MALHIPSAAQLLLAAPEAWWPSFREVHRHPFRATRSLMAALTDPEGASVADAVAAPRRCCHLSHHALAQGVFLTATWRRCGRPRPKCAFDVELLNPYGGETVRFACLHVPKAMTPVEGANVARDLAAQQHPQQNRGDGPGAVAVGFVPTLPVVADGVNEDDHDEGAVSAAAASRTEAVLALVQRLGHVGSRASSHAMASVMYCGLDSGAVEAEAARTVRRVRWELLRGAHHAGRRSTATRLVPEVRRLCLSVLLGGSSDAEVLATIRATFQMPQPQSCSGRAWVVGESATPDGGPAAPLLVVLVEELDLLVGGESAKVAIAVSELLRALTLYEAPGGGSATGMAASPRLLVVSTCAHPKCLPPALLARLSHHVVEVAVGAPVTLVDPRVPLTDPAAMSSAFEHLYGVDEAIQSLRQLILWPLAHLPLLQRLRVRCPRGALLCGPTGSGKTALLAALAKALAGAADGSLLLGSRCGRRAALNVMLVDGLTLLAKEVGQSEKNISRVFQSALAQAPTVLFLDNLDSLAPPRDRQMRETSTATDRTLSTLLTEMDGVTGGSATEAVVVIIASAPSVGHLDPAVSRPGRLDLHLQLPLPSEADIAAYVSERFCRVVEAMGPAPGDAITALGPLVEETILRTWRHHAEATGAEPRRGPRTMADGCALLRSIVLRLHREAVAVAGADVGPAHTLAAARDGACLERVVREAAMAVPLSSSP